MYVSGISTGYTMLMPLEVLEGLAADFDRITVRIQRDLYMPYVVNCWKPVKW